MNNIELETLGATDQESCIVRSNGPSWYCTLVIPLRLPFNKEKAKSLNKQSKGSLQFIQKFNFTKKLQKNDLIIENYNFSFDSYFFKVDQQFYAKTLYSIQQNPIKFSQKINIIQKAVKLICQLHEQKICVRTLSPKLLSYSPNQNGPKMKIIWLDSAVQLAHPKQLVNHEIFSGLSPEIFEYVAPEIKLNRPHGFKTDVWSLGAIFFKLLFGNHGSISLVNDQIVVDYPNNTPQWLKNIFSKFIHQDPNQRCQVSTILQYIRPLKSCCHVAAKIIPQNF